MTTSSSIDETITDEKVTSSTLLDKFDNMTSDSQLSNITVDAFYSTEYNNLQAAAAFLKNYWIWVIFAFGFPGNLISFCVVVRMSRQRLTTSLFFVALLAVVDNIAIVLKVIENRSQTGSFLMSPIGCQTLFFFGLCLGSYANWIVIVMSGERFTAVSFPLRVTLIWSIRRAVAIIGVVFLFLCCVNLHIFFTITGNKYKCHPRKEYLHFFYPYWFFISATVFSFIPSVTIVIFNVLIVRLLKKSTVQRRSMLSVSDPSIRESQHQERQVTVMLIALAVTFIVLTLPRCMFAISFGYWQPEDSLGKTRKLFINWLTSSISDSNHAINFYLYFVSGRRFRNYVLRLFQCQRKKYLEVTNGHTQMSDIRMSEIQGMSSSPLYCRN